MAPHTRVLCPRCVPLRTITHAMQEEDHTCGPAALRILLSHFRRSFTEAHLARLCHTTKDGTAHAGLIRAATSLGARVFEKERGSFVELHWFVHVVKLPVLLEWFSDDEHRPGYHFSVVMHLSPGRIWLLDPEWSSPRRIRLDEFRARWYGWDTPIRRFYGRWYMVLSFGEKLSFPFDGGTYHAPQAT